MDTIEAKFPVIKLEVVDSDIVAPPLRSRLGTHRWINETETEPACAFCGRVQSKVRTLIAGARAYICDHALNHVMKSFLVTIKTTYNIR